MIDFVSKLAAKGLFTSEAIVFLVVWWFSFERFSGDESVPVRVALIVGGFTGAALFGVARAAWKPRERKPERGVE